MTQQHEQEQAVLAALRDHQGDWKTLDAIRVHPAVAGHVPTNTGVLGQILARLVRRGEAERGLRGHKRIYRATQAADDDWAGNGFTGGGEITVPAEIIRLAEGERVTTIYDLPGSIPILAIGITTTGGLLFGVRAGKGWAFEPQWIGRIGVSASALQDVLEQVGTEQRVLDRQNYPSALRQALRDVLEHGSRTLRQIEAACPAIERPTLIAELARMRDDGEVEFTGPRYRLAKTG
jgi:hypothetical protein